MLSRGHITPEQLRDALAAQKHAVDTPIGELVCRMNFAQPINVTAALAAQWACPVIKTLPAETIECGIPRELMRCFSLVPAHFSAKNRLLHVAFAGMVDYRPVVAIETILNLKVEVGLTTELELNAALDRSLWKKPMNQKSFESRRPEDVARVVTNYTVHLHATGVRMAGCADMLWFKILGGTFETDLLFTEEGSAFRSPKELELPSPISQLS